MRKLILLMLITINLLVGDSLSIDKLYENAMGGKCPPGLSSGQPESVVYVVDTLSNFYKCECTSYVAWKLNQNGIEFTNKYKGKRWGDAGNWDDVARELGITVNDTPTIGSVGVSSGHVVYVEHVNLDGTIKISDYNSKSDHKYLIKDNVDKAKYDYIHFNEISPTYLYHDAQAIDADSTSWASIGLKNDSNEVICIENIKLGLNTDATRNSNIEGYEWEVAVDACIDANSEYKSHTITYSTPPTSGTYYLVLKYEYPKEIWINALYEKIEIQANEETSLTGKTLGSVSASGASSTSIKLGWTSMSGATNYKVYRWTGSSYKQIYYGPDTSYSDSGSHLNPNTRYTYKVQALNSNSSSDFTFVYGTTKTGTVKSTITSPSNGSKLTSSSATFTWKNTGASKYYLFVGTTQGRYDIYHGTQYGTSKTVSGLPTSGKVYVRLLTWIDNSWQYNDYSYSAETNIVKSTITSPSNGSKLTSSSATFTWKNTGASKYYLFVGTTQGHYDIYHGTQYGTSKAVSGLLKSGKVYVRLHTLIDNKWQYNDYSYTKIGDVDLSNIRPNRPTLSSTESSITVKWNAVNGADKYYLYRYVGGSWSYYKSVTGTSYSDTGLKSNTYYSYKIKAVNSKSTSLESWSNGIRTKADVIDLSKVTPSAPTVIATSSSSIKVSWSAVNGATEYQLYRYSTNVQKWVKIKTTTSRSFTDSSLSKGRYYYKIVALNSNSTSKDSGYRSQLITGDEKSIYGVDVSDNNGYISWSTAKSKGIQFAFIRSTEGYADSSWPESSAYDSRFEQNMQNAINYGMIVGIYHLARPDFNKGTSEAKKEAQYFVSKIKYYYQNHKLLPPVIDIEKTSNYYSKQTLTDWVVAFAKEVESQLGIKPIIYMNENYYYYKLYPSQLSQYKLWIARTLYNENSGVAINTLDDLNKYDSYFKPSVSNWTFWQYSWTGTNINSKNMDRNVFNGSLEDLKNLTVQVTATTKSYTFQNRWKTYINATLNNNSKWVLIKDTMYSSNAYKICQANDNTKCLHTQYGYLRSSSIGSDWKSARWTFENVDGTHIRIKNLYHTNKYIHIENGYLEASSIQSGWWSAHWKPI